MNFKCNLGIATVSLELLEKFKVEGPIGDLLIGPHISLDSDAYYREEVVHGNGL